MTEFFKKFFCIYFQETRDKWQIVFYISAGIYATGAVIFLVLARGQEQNWNNPEYFKEREVVIQT